MAHDTICALASGPPPAAIAIIRISGPHTHEIAKTCLKAGLPDARHAVLTKISDAGGDEIDEGLALYMAGPASYTGEDTLELYVHGGASVIAHLLETLCAHKGVRLAEPGEFTRRAFEAGKLDLAQAEGVADLIEAETRAQKQQALRQLGGDLSGQYAKWRSELTTILALLEVSIDFPDEDEAPADTGLPVIQTIDALLAEIDQALGEGAMSERIREGFRIAIIGAPNAGKSTLLNRLAGRDAAIVTPQAGTTRDVIEIRKIIGGQIVWFADTAGLRETDDKIEREGVRRAELAAAQADLCIYLIDGENPSKSGLTKPLRADFDLVVLNKSDLAKPVSLAYDLTISAKTGAGLAELESWISDWVKRRAGQVEAPVITRARHREALQRGYNYLSQARQSLCANEGPELAAEDVRLAIRALGEIVGRVGVEDVLGAVFSQFCIGK